MTLQELKPGMMVRGPSGTVYQVAEVGLSCAVLSSPYPTLWCGVGDHVGKASPFEEFDAVALDRFVPHTPEVT